MKLIGQSSASDFYYNHASTYYNIYIRYIVYYNVDLIVAAYYILLILVLQGMHAVHPVV